MNNFYIETFGCQMNERDSLLMSAVMEEMGLKKTASPEDADVIIVNTCSIREKSEHKVYSLLGRLRRFKKQKPYMLLGVAGCVAQQVGERFFEKVPELDMVIGTHNIHKLKDIVIKSSSGNVRGSRTSATDFFHTDAEKRFFAPLPDDFNAVTAFVTIMEGCDNFCSFCVVPYLRGRELSRSPDDILKEIKTLIGKGVKEVTLLGQNVNSYRYWRDGVKSDFPALLRMISEVEGLLRIRFTSSHPKDLSDDLINCFRELPKLCRHIHLPVQSGSTEILQRMNRRYTREDYLKLIDKIKEADSEIAITTDVIVGFPGETEGDFEETLSLVEMVRFDGIFSFKFSPRPMTASARMEPQVDAVTKTRRILQLQELQRKICMDKNAALIGKTEEVLVEGPSADGNGQLTGRTSTNRVVNFAGDDRLVGRLMPVKITGASPNTLKGDLIEKQ